jgi:hypothetical protein
MEMEENSGATTPKKQAGKGSARKSTARKTTTRKSSPPKRNARPAKPAAEPSGSKLVDVAKTIGSTMGTIATRTRRVFKRGG